MAYKDWKGSVAASDIASGTVAAARLPSLDNITQPAGDLAMNSKGITGLADPSSDQDAATKKYCDDTFQTSSGMSSYLTSSAASSTYLTQSAAASQYVTNSGLSSYATQTYVNNLIEGIDPKEICEAATTAELGSSGGWSFSSGTLEKSGSSLQIDGVTLTAGDRVLVKDQSTDKEQNGIYTFSTGGGKVYLMRASDADSVDGLANAYTFIKTDGSTNGGKGFVQTTLTGSGTINSSDVEFTQFTSSVSALTQEQVEDFAGALVASGGTKTGISVTYQDSTGDMDFVVSDLTVAGDSGSTGMTPGDTLTIKGGGSVTTAMSGDELTITCTDTNTQLSQEQVEDFAAGLITGATHTGISASYDDTNGKLALTASVTPSNIGSYAVTSGNITNHAVATVSGTTDEISVAQSSGTATLSLPDIRKVSIHNDGSDNFLDADITVARASNNLQQVYCYTITSDRTLTLPRVGGAYAPIGCRIEVKLLSAASGKKLTVAAYSGDKTDGTDQDIELDVATEQLNFTAMAASGDSTTTWIMH